MSSLMNNKFYSYVGRESQNTKYTREWHEQQWHNEWEAMWPEERTSASSQRDYRGCSCPAWRCATCTCTHDVPTVLYVALRAVCIAVAGRALAPQTTQRQVTISVHDLSLFDCANTLDLLSRVSLASFWLAFRSSASLPLPWCWRLAGGRWWRRSRACSCPSALWSAGLSPAPEDNPAPWTSQHQQPTTVYMY